jgi:hypothetical protein
MNQQANEKIFEDFFKEGHNRYYDSSKLSLTDAQQIAFHLGKLNYQVNNGGFAQWIGNGYYELAQGELLPALQEGIKNGIPYLELIYDLLLQVEDALSGTIDCENCGGEGTLPEDEEAEIEEEECDECRGRGEIDCDVVHFDAYKLDPLNDHYYQLNEDELFVAYGDLVILHIPEKERSKVIKKAQIKVIFKSK